MASLLRMAKNVKVASGIHGVAGVVLDGAVGFGASYGLGQVYHRYSDKWYGKQSARIMAAAGKLGAVALGAWLGPHIATGAVNAVGQAGLNAIGLEMGLRHARTKTGKKAVLIPKDAALPAGASEMASIGALGRAPAGRGLSWDQIEELAQGR